MIYALETLRGFAALAVAFFHFPSLSLLYFESGHLAVYFFFILSGFVITLNYFDRIITLKDLIKFQTRRFFRLYPVHLFVLLIVLSVQIIKYFLIKNGMSSGSEAFGDWYTLKDFILHLFLLQAVVDGGYFLSWNSSAWSISTEFYTYFLFGLLVFIFCRNKFFFILFALIYQFYSSEIFLFLDKIFLGYLNAQFNLCLGLFFLGSLMFFIYEKISFRINDFLFIFLSIFFYFFIFFINQYFNFSFSFYWALLILFCALLKKDSFIYRFLNFKIFVSLGSISYSFYMIHQVVLYLIIQLLKIFNLGFTFSEVKASSTGSIFFDTFITIFYVFVSIVIAVLMNKFIEKKFRIKKWS